MANSLPTSSKCYAGIDFGTLARQPELVLATGRNVGAFKISRLLWGSAIFEINVVGPKVLSSLRAICL